MKTGILGYGTYVPRYRVKIAEIAAVWGKQAQDIERSLGIQEKAVPARDEDAVTLALEAASNAVRHAGISAADIGVCFVGSESHPYAVNPTATIVAELLGVGNTYLAADLEFACKAATTGLVSVSGLVAADQVEMGLIIGSDTAQAAPHDVLEYTAGSAAAAIIVGKATDAARIATITATASYSSDTPDFWRRDGVRFPSHGGRFTGEPAYFAHVIGAASLLLEKTTMQPSDFSYCIFHSPNGKFPQDVAKRLGFTPQQLAPSRLVDQIGNPYSASAFMSLCTVLDVARSGEKIFLVSYGSGAGSDAFVITVESGIEQKRPSVSIRARLEEKEYISYVDYLKYTKKI